MKNSIREELIEYANESVIDRNLSTDNEDLHHLLFNEDYYIIGYYQCSEWLKKHYIGEFEALELLYELQEEHFGERQELERINSEVIVNQLVYFWGFEIMDELDTQN